MRRHREIARPSAGSNRFSGGAARSTDSDAGQPSRDAKAPDAADRLGVEPVGKLLLKFSVPAITGMIVNALYNVVDRVFVGRGVDEIALGGLGLVMPIMTVSMALAMLFGIGAANMISIRLGQRRRDEAENALNHCLWLLIAAGAAVMTLGLFFIDPLLSAMGAIDGTDATGYARDYLRVILYGQVFSMVGFGFSHCSRAQGFPLVTMTSMLIGAGMNIALDPLFIFVFRWGVQGAALATIISQFASMALVLRFSFSKKAVVRLRLASFRPSWRFALKIMSFGSASFALQLMASLVQTLFNQSIKRYGAVGLGLENGAELAMSAMNIANSVLMFVLMPVFGINQGSQAILGYNYGAKKYGRALSCYVRSAINAVAVCTAGMLAAQLFSRQLVELFVPDASPALSEFAQWTMRVMSALFPLVGFQIVSSYMFVATGRPKMSMALSLTRQAFFLAPLIVAFGAMFGLRGIVIAAPVSDGVAFAVTAFVIAKELRKLSRMAREAPVGLTATGSG